MDLFDGEGYVQIGRAAKHLGISRQTLRKHLGTVCGLTFRPLGHGNRPVIAKSDLRRVRDAMTPQRTSPALRKVS